MAGMFVAQLLPDEIEARVIRDALVEHMENHPSENTVQDVCWKFISKISIDLRKER